MRTTLSVLALLAVAACGGSSSSTTPTEEVETPTAGGELPSGATGLSFADFGVTTDATAEAAAFDAAIEAFVADASDIDGKALDAFNNTAFVRIPDEGSADFSGFLNVNAGPTANLAAGLDLTADFDNDGKITAEQTTDFFGITDGVLEAYEGELTFLNGLVGARGIANNARLDIVGTLTNETNTVEVDGEITGKLRGTPIVGITGETAVADRFGADNDQQRMSITLNGEEVSAGSAGFAVIAN